MVQGHDYIFALMDGQNNFYCILNDGSVSLTSQPYFLKFSPSGWDDIAIKNIRNKKYFGIDRSVSLPLSYVRDGGKIIKHVLYNDGIEASLYLVIAQQQLDYVPGVHYGFWYKKLFRGEVDLSAFTHDSSKVTVTTLEDGLAKYLKSNESTIQEYPFDESAINVKMDGINLHEKLNYQEIDKFEIVRSLYGLSFLTPATFINAEGDSTGIIMQTQTLQDLGGLTWDQILALDNYIVRNVGSTTVNIKLSGRMELKCTDMVSLPAYAFRARFLTSTQTLVNQNLYQIPFPVFSSGVYSTGNMDVGQTYFADYEINIPLQPNEKLFFEGIYFGGPGSEVKIEFTENSKFKIEFITRKPTTYIKAYRPQALFQKIIASVTEGKYIADMSMYLLNNKDVVFTSGNAIRGIEDATIKISLNDFFEFWDSFDSVGLFERDGMVDFGRKKEMIDTSNVIPLGIPAFSTLKVSIAKEYLLNELEIGYAEMDNEVGVLNGKQEFNTKFLFSVGTVKSPAKLSKIPNTTASCYQIEKIRVTTFDKDSTDYKADNKNFVLHIEANQQPESGIIPAHYKLNRDLNSTVTNGLVEAGTVFNLYLSPKRNLLRNADFIHSCFYRNEAKVFSFKSASDNQSLVCDGIVEKDDVPLSSLDDPFFQPIYFDGEFNAPDNIIDLLDVNPLQVLSFSINGETFKGVMMDGGISPSTRKTQEYKLLSLATNDLTKLTDFYG